MSKSITKENGYGSKPLKVWSEKEFFELAQKGKIQTRLTPVIHPYKAGYVCQSDRMNGM